MKTDISEKDIDKKIEEMLITPENAVKVLLIGLSAIFIAKKICTTKELNEAVEAGREHLRESWKKELKNPETKKQWEAAIFMESLLGGKDKKGEG